MHLVSPFEPTEHATPEELRTRLRALARILARAPVPIAVAHDAECRFISANDALSRLLPWIGAMGMRDGRPTAYVCREFTCQAPTTDAAVLRTQL